MRCQPIDHGKSNDGQSVLEFRIDAPDDCTRSDELTSMTHAARRAIGVRPRRLVLDLIRLRSMNCQLLSTIIYLGRECMCRQIDFAVENMTPDFEAWASSHRLIELLRTIGVTIQPQPIARVAR